MKRLTLFSLLLWAMLVPLACSRRSADHRLIVLGFDGADPELMDRWMAEGKLPNFKALRDSGSYQRLATTNPAQSPTAWTSFATGLNPGRTNVFGFLRRVNTGDRPMPEISYVQLKWRPILGHHCAVAFIPPIFSIFVLIGMYTLMAREAQFGRLVSFLTSLIIAAACAIAIRFALHQWLPTHVFQPQLVRRGHDFWETLGENGIQSKVISAPLTFPAESLSGCQLLTGLGTPDLNGTHGTWTVYSSEAALTTQTETGGVIRPVNIAGNSIYTDIVGPDNPIIVEQIRDIQAKLASSVVKEDEKNRLRKELQPAEGRRPMRTALRIRLYPATSTVSLRSGLQSHSVAVGQWSKWMELRFSASPFISVYGMARFYLVSLAPKFELYMSPIAIDPSHVPPTVDISTPRPYSAHLAKEVGPYDTLGWSAPTNPVKDEKLSYDALLSYVWSYLRQRREMVIKELEKDDWACFCAVFEEPDHLSHMLWRFEDRQHPMYDENLAAKYGGELLKVYQYMDQIVAEVRARFAHRHTALIVVSDHGFKSFRRSVNINTWLAQNGYMALRGASPSMKLADLSDPTDAFFTNVDWARTRAYSMDLGKIFINLRGREPQGTVSPGPEYERLCQEIGQKFEKLTDPETGQPVVCKVYRREQIYQGPYVTDEADLIVGFNAGYRVSWQTCLGGMGEKAVEANRNAWSGDHCSLDPTQVPGIFFSNCKIDRQDISILDIAPTILEYFHQHARKPLDGRAFHLLRQ